MISEEVISEEMPAASTSAEPSRVSGVRSPDACWKKIASHQEADPAPLIDFLTRFTGLTKRTDLRRVQRAVNDELEDIARQALAILARLATEKKAPKRALDALSRQLRAALAPSAVGEHFVHEGSRHEGFIHEKTLSRFLARCWLQIAEPSAREALQRLHRRYTNLSTRLEWLLRGTTQEQLKQLDPIQDSDRIYHSLMSNFRVEARVLELLAINRIAQSSLVSMFFRSTRESEDNGVARFYDTYTLLANFFEWGEESRRGREAIARMNQIHGRYFIPNAGMKYVLLQNCFTWLEGADRIGHRPLLEVERRGLFHAHVRMGRHMHIADISDDYAAMHAWFLEFSRSNSKPHPLKRHTFEAIIHNSIPGNAVDGLKQALLCAARVAMADEYLSAIGYAPPNEQEQARVRSAIHALGSVAEQLPSSCQIRSLQNNPARREYTCPFDLGVKQRSRHLPAPKRGEEGSGEPPSQRPLQHAAEAICVELPTVSREEVALHDRPGDLWVILDEEVYDLSSIAEHHPGGLEVLLARAGQDATAAYRQARHCALTDVFRLNYRVARVAPQAQAASMNSLQAPVEPPSA